VTTSVTTHFESASFSSKANTVWYKTARCDSYFRE